MQCNYKRLGHFRYENRKLRFITRRTTRHIDCLCGSVVPLISFIATSKQWRTLIVLLEDFIVVSMGFPLYVPKFLVFNVSSSSSRHECTKRGKTDAACCNVQRVSTMLQLVKVSLILDNYVLVPREIVFFILSVSPETSSRETSRYMGKKKCFPRGQ